ncbi:hypothetical protein [Roseisolibacter agri]|uniref:Uncharacterized protein n=1 Tax=Roseisolibacter agri TaxID=2014610 RepID=A0AA37V2J3_9BACT|nr:hypothetical protein [Roseisolibacter agri]GLC27895.1 hypothetical protein rosag_44080 [Roseisolibacter agri]
MRSRTATTPSRLPRGDTIVEALVALLLLATGALALIGHTATLTRDERRAAARHHAAALLEARAAEWAGAPCADGAGARTVDGLAESWTASRDADSLAILVDSLRAADDRGGVRAGLVAVRGCAP